MIGQLLDDDGILDCKRACDMGIPRRGTNTQIVGAGLEDIGSAFLIIRGKVFQRDIDGDPLGFARCKLFALFVIDQLLIGLFPFPLIKDIVG